MKNFVEGLTNIIPAKFGFNMTSICTCSFWNDQNVNSLQTRHPVMAKSHWPFGSVEVKSYNLI
jgi:hypothetical protein